MRLAIELGSIELGRQVLYRFVERQVSSAAFEELQKVLPKCAMLLCVLSHRTLPAPGPHPQ
jgi:hypothetical protein